jgi:hypothetical protein
VNEWLSAYVAVMTNVAIFGGSITFTVIVADLVDPSTLQTRFRASFAVETVRLWVALGWMCFTFTLGISCIAAILYADNTLKFVPPSRWGFIDFVLKLMLLVLSALPICAFGCLSLAVAAYVPVVGWLVLGLCVVYLGVVLILVMYAILKQISFLKFPHLTQQRKDQDAQNSSNVNVAGKVE